MIFPVSDRIYCRMRSKREILSIHSPTLVPLPSPGEEQNQSSLSARSVNINFDMLVWTHILAPKEVIIWFGDFSQEIFSSMDPPPQISYRYCEGVCDPEIILPHVFTTSAAYVPYVSTKHI